MESALTTSKLLRKLFASNCNDNLALITSLTLFSIFGIIDIAFAQFKGAALSAGWNEGKIEVVVYQYSATELKDQKNTTAEIYSLKSNTLYTTVDLKLEESRKVKKQMANPCEVGSDRSIYLNIYRGNAPPDMAGYDYKINWVSTAVTADPVSTERIMDKNILLSCALSGNSKTDLAVIEYNKDPFFYLCMGNSIPQMLDVKSKIPTRNKTLLQPVSCINLKESNVLPLDGEVLSNEPTLIEWKKGFSATIPLGKDAMIIDETTSGIEFIPKEPGIYLVSEGITQEKSELINTVRTYFIEVSQ